MDEVPGTSAQEVRFEVFSSYKELFANAPIRLMSRTVNKMQALGFADVASAIGDMDWRTVPADDPEDPELRHDWSTLVAGSMEHLTTWLAQLGVHPMGYNLDSVGYPAVCRAWSGLWEKQLGISFSNSGQTTPQVFIFHGGNQALQAALLGAAEARRERLGKDSRATVAIPIPTFSCPLDQLALQGMNAFLIPPQRPDMDPCAGDLDQSPAGSEVDAVYLMPITNPTGRTIVPEQLRALVAAVLDRWPHAAVILDAVYVRMHAENQTLLGWYDEDPRFAESVVFIDSLSKTHGVTGVRAGAILTRSQHQARGITRYAQNVVAGPSNLMQALTLSLLAPFSSYDHDLQESRLRLQLRIGRHMRRRRRLLLQQAFADHGDLLATKQPVIPACADYDWEGSLYGVLRLSERCLEIAKRHGLPPAIAFYLETGIGGVPLAAFCRNPNLERYGYVVNHDQPELAAFHEETSRYMRLSVGMTRPVSA